jgi:uncharacterized SAM-binding protein YcdF (DUF218 family)
VVKTVTRFLAAVGAFFLLYVGVAVGGGFAAVETWLADVPPPAADVDFILLLPGGPIPSGSTMVRVWYAAEEFRKRPGARVVVSHKTEGPVDGSTIGGIRDELILRGVAPDAIVLETKATDTAEHARYVKEAGWGDPAADRYLVVTSRSHLRRGVGVFAAAGFRHVSGRAAAPEKPAENMGGLTAIRYGVWEEAQRGITVIRELTALAWYRLTGKI